MQINLEIIGTTLDTMAFFFATPDLIGKVRLDGYGQRLDRWASRAWSFLGKAAAVGRPAALLLGIFLGGFILYGSIIGGILRIVFGVNTRALLSNDLLPSILRNLFAFMVYSVFVALAGSLLLYVLVAILRSIAGYLSRHDLSGVFLLFGAVLFLIARAIEFRHELGFG